MRFIKPLIFGLSLATFASAGFAGEDSTHRVNCTGASYWEIPNGLQDFAAAQPEC